MSLNFLLVVSVASTLRSIVTSTTVVDYSFGKKLLLKCKLSLLSVACEFDDQNLVVVPADHELPTTYGTGSSGNEF